MISIRYKLTLGLAVAATLATLFLRPQSPPPVAPPEIREAAASELVRRGERMFFGDETEPFTGVLVERYASGELKWKSRMAGGILHGLSEGWHTNGVSQVQEHFHAGVSHGVRTKYSSTGRKISEAAIENGKIVGPFRRWHENGELAELLHLKDGEPEGESWAFYPSGFARASARHERGALVHQESWKDGERKLAASELTNAH